MAEPEAAPQFATLQDAVPWVLHELKLVLHECPGPEPPEDEDHATLCRWDGRHYLDGGECSCGLWDRIFWWEDAPRPLKSDTDTFKVVDAMKARCTSLSLLWDGECWDVQLIDKQNHVGMARDEDWKVAAIVATVRALLPGVKIGGVDE